METPYFIHVMAISMEGATGEAGYANLSRNSRAHDIIVINIPLIYIVCQTEFAKLILEVAVFLERLLEHVTS